LCVGGFLRTDPLTGKTGHTLASVLIFGTDDTIMQVAPGMTFDAILRRQNLDRYDDRVLLRTNLIQI
jgi:ATP-dependent DNA helicase RecG